MKSRMTGTKSIFIAVVFAAIGIVFFTCSSAFAAGQVIVELRQNAASGVTYPSVFTTQEIAGTNTTTKQEYKFQRQREGKNFSYVIANLDPSSSYYVELSFVEHDFMASGKRIFNVYLQSILKLSKLDIYSQVKANTAYQKTFQVVSDSAGRIALQLRSDQAGCRDYATISTVRIFKGSANAVEIDAFDSRTNMDLPVRHTNTSQQNVMETVLSRLGSRFCLNLMPQRLGARLSTLGDGTGDLGDFIVGIKSGSTIRCLPFTDRFTVWENCTETMTMTSQSFDCSSSGYPFTMNVTFRAPFYPGEDKISGAPLVYMDVTVSNQSGGAATGDFIFAKPNKYDFATSGVSAIGVPADPYTGIMYSTKYNIYEETFNNPHSKTATEAIALPSGESSGVDFRGDVEAEFNDFSVNSLWGYSSPSGYPKGSSEYKKPVYSAYPRGYTGAVWSLNLPAGGSETKHFVLSGYCPDAVLSVENKSFTDTTYRFRYKNQFSNVEDVVDYAVSDRWAGDEMQGKSEFFDSTISSDSYLTLPSDYSSDVKQLIPYSFQSYLMNTWWTHSDGGRDWFSVWEGSSCRFQSTVDVTYNEAWFYFQYWPDLLKQIIDEWVLYTKDSAQGTYLSHDMGWGNYCSGQAYFHDMAVEENVDFILLLYKHWKITGDTGFMRNHFPTVRKFIDFVINCDANKNGLPDLNTSNTIDDASLAIQSGKDQSYLGIKCLAAHQAAREMAASQSVPDATYMNKCRGQVQLINQTLNYDMWLSDHFAVCIDGNVEAADREAYSIYPSNGLLYLLGSGSTGGVTAGNYAKLRTDIANVVNKTLKEYGCTHSSYDSYTQWVSQNLWRDQLSCYMNVNLYGGNPLKMSERYLALEKYFARNLNGSFYDVIFYPGYVAHGADRTGQAGNGASLNGGSSSYNGRKWPLGADSESGGSSGGASSTIGQQLGYYPRGITSAGLLDAVAGLSIDIISGEFYYAPTVYPVRVPVLSQADWANADPSKRVPTLYFPSASSSPTVKNSNLLPATVQPRQVVDINNIQASGHAISPNGDGINDSATVTYQLPVQSSLIESIWGGAEEVKSTTYSNAGSGTRSFTWDGKSGAGAAAEDGVYTAAVEAAPKNTSIDAREGTAPVYVNRSVPDLAYEWYLAEGYTGRNATGGDFEEYVLIQNPNPEAASVNVTFMLPGGETVIQPYQIAPNSRFTVTVDNILPSAEVSTHVSSDRPIAVERAMYFNGRRAGHASIGVSRPSDTWYLAEGYTADNFDEYVLIQNPGEQAAEIKATFMTPGAGNEERAYTVGPHSRFTIHVDEIIPAQSVSTMIESSQPVVVERAQYLNSMTAGTCSIGAVSTSRTWYLAEGYTDQGFEEWVLIQNPGDGYTDVTVTLMESTGTNTVRTYELPPASRFTILVNNDLPASEVSVKVNAENPVLVERAMYWNNRSDGHDSIGTPTPDSSWFLAEGYTDQGFETWILVQNPGDETLDVTFTFMQPGGQNTVKTYQVSPRSRFTVGVDELFPASEVSTRISANGPIIVERAMYFNGRSGGTDSIGIRGF
ncbi:MAG: DUF4965 domain-containing protein [Actinobacteria bacterium]|nr:DUF4965 domain-containing protein [Actinomycetota bacterium]